MLGLLIMGALSTSATAYAGSAVLGCVYLFDLARRVLDRQAFGRDALGWEIGILAVAALIGCAVAALAPGKIAPAFDVIDKVVFSKSESYSYYQRSLWTHTGWLAFLDTGGLGVGLGSVRTSNWSVSILASTGVFGGLLLFGFIAQKLLQRTSHLSREDAAFAIGVKLSLAPALVMTELSGTIPDIGFAAAAALGLLSAAAPAAAGSTVDPSAAAPEPAQSAARTASPRRRRRVGRPALFWRDPSLSPQAAELQSPFIVRRRRSGRLERRGQPHRIAPPSSSFDSPASRAAQDEVGGRSMATTND